MRPIHPAAEIFPAMSDDEYRDLVEDIRKNGLREAVWIDADGAIVDGRHRVRACDELGVQYATRVCADVDIVAFVVSLNLHRRSLTPSQRAMCAARSREIFDAEAKERQVEGQERGRQSQKGLVVKVPPTNSLKSRDAAGKAFGVGGSSVERATRVLQQGTPELVEAVDKGQISVHTAVQLVELPAEQQREEIIKRPYNAKRATREPVRDDDEVEIKVQGVGVVHAHEAINCLQRIPKNDKLRARGFQIVSDWMRKNK